MLKLQKYILLFIVLFTTGCGMQVKETHSPEIVTPTSFGTYAAQIKSNLERSNIMFDADISYRDPSSSDSYNPNDVAYEWTFDFVDPSGTHATCVTAFNLLNSTVSTYTTSVPDCAHYSISGLAQNPIISPDTNFIQGKFTTNYCLRIKIPGVGITSLANSCSSIDSIVAKIVPKAVASLSGSNVNLTGTVDSVILPTSQTYNPNDVAYEWTFDFVDPSGTHATCVTAFNLLNSTVSTYTTSVPDCAHYSISGLAQNPIISPDTNFIQGKFTTNYCLRIKIPGVGITSLANSCSSIDSIVAKIVPKAVASLSGSNVNLTGTVDSVILPTSQTYNPNDVAYEWTFDFVDTFGKNITCATDPTLLGTSLPGYTLTSSSLCSQYSISGLGETPIITHIDTGFDNDKNYTAHYCLRISIPSLSVSSVTNSCGTISAGTLTEPEKICQGNLAIDNVKVFSETVIPGLNYRYKPMSTNYPSAIFSVICDEQDLQDIADYMKTLSSPMAINLIMGKSLDMADYYLLGHSPFSLDTVNFSAIFEGNNLIIKNFKYTAGATANPIGFISNAVNAEIRNFIFINTLIKDGSQTNSGNGLGGVAGQMINSLMESIFISGNIYCNNSSAIGNCGGLVGNVQGGNSTVQQINGQMNVYGNSAANAGGLVGRLSTALATDHNYIKKSHNTGNVIALGGSSSGAGGIAGILKLQSSIEDSWSSGNIEVITGAGNAGGLVGVVANNATITRSYSRANVLKTNFSGNAGAGGLVGQLVGSITDSYATGSVTGISSVGGLVGYAWVGSVNRVHAAGRVTATGVNIGGALGRSAVTVSNCFYDRTTTTINSGPYCTGLTSAQMILPSSFTTFNFSTIWNMGTLFPELR